jgi:hypothetical protein
MVIGRGRPREHPKDTSKGSRDLRSLRMLHNFRLRIPKGTPKGSSDLWSHPVAMLLPHKKKTRGKAGACAEPTSGQGHFQSRDFHFRPKGVTRADMAQLPVAHAQNILPDMGHFRSRD